MHKKYPKYCVRRLRRTTESEDIMEMKKMVVEIKAGTMLTEHRFAPEDRDALEMIILAAQQATCPNAKNCSGCGIEGKDCEDKHRFNAITTVLKMLGRIPKENETTGPDVSIGCAAFKEDICSKTAATWIRTERYATAGNLLGCGIHTGSSDTTFPAPDGHG